MRQRACGVFPAWCALGAGVVWLTAVAVPGGSPAEVRPPESVIVGTKDAPPFSMTDAAGNWSGLSIELWHRIAARLGLTFRLEERDLEGLFEGVADGTLDLAVAAISVTAEREEVFDFSHPIHTSGLAIAVRNQGGGWAHALRQLVSLDFLRVVALLLALLFVVGLVVWFFERRRNPEHFVSHPGPGIAAGLWWAAVTMTTVGYGDKAPVTPGGRIIAVVWMFVGVIIISGFTAAITSSLTVSHLGSPVAGPDDLHRVRVASVPHTASAAYLERNVIPFTSHPSLAGALEALAGHEVDAVVYDAPLLRYLIARRPEKDVRVLPHIFERQDYAILLPDGSPLREPINRALLEITRSEQWTDSIRNYLGR